MYRTAMGSVALGRLFLLTLMYPFGNLLWDKQSLRYASEKWKVVLKWAIGRQKLALGDR
jgi:hypothetical protein